jgi:hypothetical protein
MKPKPFWPLNHFTVPVVIVVVLVPKRAHARSRAELREPSNLSDVFGKEHLSLEEITSEGHLRRLTKSMPAIEYSAL